MNHLHTCLQRLPEKCRALAKQGSQTLEPALRIQNISQTKPPILQPLGDCVTLGWGRGGSQEAVADESWRIALMDLVIMFCPLKVPVSINRTWLFQFLTTHACDTSLLFIQPTVKEPYPQLEGTISLECVCAGEWASCGRLSLFLWKQDSYRFISAAKEMTLLNMDDTSLQVLFLEALHQCTHARIHPAHTAPKPHS